MSRIRIYKRQSPKEVEICLKKSSKLVKTPTYKRRAFQKIDCSKNQIGEMHIRPNLSLVNFKKNTRITRNLNKCKIIESKLIYLKLPEDAYQGVACWSGGPKYWANVTVAIAYDARYTKIKKQMCSGGIARKTLIIIANEMAKKANWSTGRDCRPTNKQLQDKTGFKERTIQRAHECLRLLGIATEIVRGRKLSRIERETTKEFGDKKNGWASVWALHDEPGINRTIYNLSPHLGRSFLKNKNSLLKILTTKQSEIQKQRNREKKQNKYKNKKGLTLAKSWRANKRSPSWAQKYSVTAWAAILERPAQNGWIDKDINHVINDWIRITKRTIPNTPYKPIGLLGVILIWYGIDNFSERPAASEEARIAAELKEAAERIKKQKKEPTKPNGPYAGGYGRIAAMAVAAAAKYRAIKKRTAEAARQQRELEKAVERARKNYFG